ncbi:GMC family oxidoreductase N-terminal domain-containing protein [Kribbella sp. NPDC004536]|uniref:GMC family oxidoreductase N-terminal domain-containing protein n=1 Tax=Kribbella sp. NPDC004536 TaxID=3364106 RepID=UPI0036A07879
MYDVIVIGSGFGGAIPAYRLAAAGCRVVLLERGPYLTAQDFRHDLRLGTFTRIVDAIKGDGLTVIAGNCVGGSSVVYYGASLRAPSFAFDRTGGSGRRLWPAAISRSTLDPYYDRVERVLPVSRQSWSDVSYAGGLFAAACHHAGHTANPIPVAVDLNRCTNCNWMLSGCKFDAKRSLLLNYIPAAVNAGAEIRPLHQVELISRAALSTSRYRVTYTKLSADDYRLPVGTGCLEANTIVLAAGAIGTPVILRRSELLLDSIPDAVGKYLSGNGDRIHAAVMNEAAIKSVLGLHRTAGIGYEAHHIGKAINTMSYDYLDPALPEFGRFGLQQIALPALTNLLAGWPDWFGVNKKSLRSLWRSWLTLLAMTEDGNPGYLNDVPVTGSFVRLAQGFGTGTFTYQPDSHTRAGWATADDKLRTIIEHDALGMTHPWSDATSGSVTAHPLGTCRLGDDPAISALTSDHELRGHPGLYVTDAAAIPAALTVNPSLTVAALAERASERILGGL